MTTSSAATVIGAHTIAAGKGRSNAFTGLSFALPRGSFSALAGPNGAGKSTLFDAILGLVPVRAGTLRVLGEMPGMRQNAIGYVPQRSELPHDAQLSGYEFVAAAYQGEHWGFPLRLRRVRRAVEAVLTIVDAAPLARQKLANLSGGQRQRLLIAQSLVNQPRLLLLDEPLAQLDPSAQMQIVDLVARLSREQQLTVLLSTHDLNPLLAVTDHVLYLAGGQGRTGTVDEVVNDTTLSELYGTPTHVIREHGRVFVVHADATANPQPDAAPAQPLRMRA